MPSQAQLPETLETDRLILRPFTSRDLDDFHLYVSDPATMEYEPECSNSLDQSAQILEWRIDNADFYAVELKESHRAMGNLYLGGGEGETRNLGYVFGKPFWGNGYATEACVSLIASAWEVGLERIEAFCDPLNPRSWRLLERVGFRRFAYLEKNVYFHLDCDGQPIWKDTYKYARDNPLEAPRELG